MPDEPEDSGRRSLHIEAEFPDPPQIRRPEPEPPGLLRKSVIAGAVAGIISSAPFCGCGSVLLSGSGVPGEALLVFAIPGALVGMAVWIGFVICRRRLFARRPRRPRSRY